MKIPVSDLLVRFMQKLGIDHIFGMPGAHILPVYDSLFNSDIKTILAKHEQGASFMAGGYSRASGNISACIATAGPGATNLITGIANAYADKQAILVITGETPTHIFGKGGLQESSGEGGAIDQITLFDSITKYSKLIERTDYLTNVLNNASKILLSNNPGPVLLSIPYNIQKELVEESILEKISFSLNKHLFHEDIFHQSNKTLEALVQLIKQSTTPIIVAGYGCIASNAQKELTEFCQFLNIPVTSSLKAKGAISEQSDLSLGSLGVTSYGNAYQYVREKSDLVIFLGASFNERTSYVWESNLLKNKKIIQIDNHTEQLEKVFLADLAILGDIKLILSALLEQLKSIDIKPKAKPDFNLSNKNMQGLADQFPIIEKFYTSVVNYFPRNLTLFDDNIIFAQNFFQVSSENSYFPNSGISSLGHAIPAAIGAAFYHALSTHDVVKKVDQEVDKNTKTIFALLGDGGFQMCCMEIMTAVNYQLPITIILINNSTMGLIRKNQSQQYDKRFINCDFINPDYAVLAQSFGINYYEIKTEDDVEQVIPAVNYSQINLIEIFIDKDSFPGYLSHR